MKIRPVMFRWQQVDICAEGGEVRRMKVMVPHQRFGPLSERQYEVDEDYALGPVENVSTKSRGHMFAAIKEAWDSLPYDLVERFPSPEHLRKWSLIQAGHCVRAEYALDTAKDAKKMAIGLRKVDAYAQIVVRGTVVAHSTAKSISPAAIKADQFKTVKDAALNHIAELIGTTKAELEKHSADGGAR